MNSISTVSARQRYLTSGLVGALFWLGSAPVSWSASETVLPETLAANSAEDAIANLPVSVSPRAFGAFSNTVDPSKSALIIRVAGSPHNAPVSTSENAPVLIALYASEQAFRLGDSIEPHQVSAMQSGNAVQIDVPVGAYALRAFRDLNGNGALDTGLFGRPVEPVFYSNAARSLVGSPAWSKTRFRLTGGVMSLEVALD